MKQLLLCRRTFIAVLAIAALTAIGILNHTDVALAISSVAIGLAGANSFENSMRHKFENAPKES